MRFTAWLLLVAGAASGQSLIGTWENVDEDEEGRITSVMDLLDGGGVRLTSDGVLTGLLEVEQSPFPEGLRLSFDGSGTWSVSEDRLFLNLSESRLLLDGEDFDTGLLRVAEAFAVVLAEALEIPAEELDEFTADIYLGLFEELNEQALLAELLGDLQNGIPYRMDGERVWRTDSDGVDAPWARRLTTAVVEGTWADVKRFVR